MRAPPAYVTRGPYPSIHLSVTSRIAPNNVQGHFAVPLSFCWTLFSPLLICQYYLSLALLSAECVQHVLRPKGRGQFACLTPFDSLRWFRPPSVDRLDKFSSNSLCHQGLHMPRPHGLSPSPRKAWLWPRRACLACSARGFRSLGRTTKVGLACATLFPREARWDTDPRGRFQLWQFADLRGIGH